VAILGCRSRGTAAARAYYQHPRTQVVGLCDLVPERVNALGDELGVAARYQDLDRMIGETGPEIVAIPTGTELHYQLGMRALEHGVHLDVEKPLCTDLQEADRLLARAEKKGARIAVHHQGRSGGAMKAIRKAIAEGRIGRLRYLCGSGKGYYAGYGLMNIGTHLVNAMLGVAGHVRSAAATALVDGRSATPQDVLVAAGGMGYVVGEHVTAVLEFESGITGALLQHRFPKVDSTAYMMEIYGTEGRLLWQANRAWWLKAPHFAPGMDGNPWQALEPVVPEHYDPAGKASEADYAYVEDYVRALDEGGQHECSGAEGRHVLEVLLGVFESAAYGRRVALPQKDRQHPLLRWRQEAGLGPPLPGPRPYGEWLAAEDQRLGR
jgi:predicted dehydrogenase